MPKYEEFHILLHKLLIILTTMHPQKLGYKNTKWGAIVAQIRYCIDLFTVCRPFLPDLDLKLLLSLDYKLRIL